MTFDLSAINWLAVLVAALASFMVGGLWYGAIFGKKWIEVNGHDEAAQKAMAERQGKTFLGFIIGDLIAASAIAILMNNLENPSVGVGVGLAFLIWIGALAPIGHAKNAANGRPLGVWLLDTPHELLSVMAMAMVIGGWR